MRQPTRGTLDLPAGGVQPGEAGGVGNWPAGDRTAFDEVLQDHRPFGGVAGENARHDRRFDLSGEMQRGQLTGEALGCIRVADDLLDDIGRVSRLDQPHPRSRAAGERAHLPGPPTIGTESLEEAQPRVVDYGAGLAARALTDRVDLGAVSPARASPAGSA